MIIGITGNTGSGKTYISSILKSKGAYVIDADKIYHNNLINNKIMIQELINYFGNKILDKNNKIDTKKLSNIVFSKKEELDILNKITHKYIIKDIKKAIENNKKNYKYLVLDAPLLIETNLNKICNKVCLVYANTNICIERIIKRDKITKKEAIKRINNQNKFEKLKNYADIIIKNNNDDLTNYIYLLLQDKEK